MRRRALLRAFLRCQHADTGPASPAQYALTPLCWAAERGRAAVVALLLARGADVHASSKARNCESGCLHAR